MSKSKSIEEMRVLSSRLGELGRVSRSPRVGDVERYHQLAKELESPECLSDALLEKALHLIREGRLYEATQTFETALRDAPFSPSLVKASENVLGMVHDELIALAAYDPANPEFGATFERMLELGFVGHPVQVGAVRHYMLRGETEKAVKRLLLIAQVAPCAPGIAEVAARLAEISDNADLQQLQLRKRENQS